MAETPDPQDYSRLKGKFVIIDAAERTSPTDTACTQIAGRPDKLGTKPKRSGQRCQYAR
jgi:hypothetical protein